MRVSEILAERPQKENVTMEIQVEKLLKHLLLDNRDVASMLAYLHHISLVRKRAVLFDILFSKRHRKAALSILKRTKPSKAEHAQPDRLQKLLFLLEDMWRQHPELKEELCQPPPFPYKRELLKITVADRFNPIHKIMSHVVLENPELPEEVLRRTLLKTEYKKKNYTRRQRFKSRVEGEREFEPKMQHLLLRNPELVKGGMLDILYLRSAQEKKDHLENLLQKLLEHLLLEYPELDKEDLLYIFFRERFRSEVLDLLPRAQKEMDNRLLENLYLLLTEGGFIQKEGLLDAIYSKRHRKEVWEIVNSMISHDYADSCDDVASSEDDVCRRKLREEMIRLADRRKRLIEHEKKYGVVAWYDSITYPLDPSSICDDMPPYFKYDLSLRVNEVKFLVDCGEQQSKRPSIRGVKESPNVVSLLSLGDVSSTKDLVASNRNQNRTRTRMVLKPDTFRGKYVMVFCINLPVLIGPNFQCLLNLCKELAGKCEMVMVARMNIMADREETFDGLFTLFPSCLAVPYEDWNRRECIWKTLDCGVDGFQCFVYGTDGLFLESFYVHEFRALGAEAFPFTDRMTKEVLDNRKILREGGLEDLLRPYKSSSPVYVHKLGTSQVQRISELMEKKHVGLYVCYRGLLIPRLSELLDQCKQKNQEFEIVVLYLPTLSSIEPDLFKKKIDKVLQEHNIHEHGWWCLPFNNSVSLRLWGLTMGYECEVDDNWEDKLIIVGPEGKILDMYGASILKEHGHVYPFTRLAVAKKKAEEMRKEMCLELLSGSELFLGGDPKETTIPARELLDRKKKIIIFMACPNELAKRFVFQRLISQYKQMKDNMGDEFEVIFIEYEPADQDEMLFSAMPWYVLRQDDRSALSPLARKLMALFDAPELLVGFGEDCHICSVKPLERFPPKRNICEYGDLCLDDTLEDDMYRINCFCDYCDI